MYTHTWITLQVVSSSPEHSTLSSVNAVAKLTYMYHSILALLLLANFFGKDCGEKYHIHPQNVEILNILKIVLSFHYGPIGPPKVSNPVSK